MVSEMSNKKLFYLSKIVAVDFRAGIWKLIDQLFVVLLFSWLIGSLFDFFGLFGFLRDGIHQHQTSVVCEASLLSHQLVLTTLFADGDAIGETIGTSLSWSSLMVRFFLGSGIVSKQLQYRLTTNLIQIFFSKVITHNFKFSNQ